MQKTLSLIIAAAIIYSLVQTKWHSSSEPEESKSTAENTKIENTTTENTPPNHDLPNKTKEESQELTGNFLERSISKIIINSLKTEQGRVFFENLLQPQNKSGTSDAHTIDVKEDLVGSLFKINSFGNDDGRESATCGQEVTIKYQILDTNNNLINDDTATFVLGTKPIIPGIDIITVGMKIGQSRQAIILPQYAYYNPPYRKENLDNGASYRVNIVLNSINSHNLINDNEVKIFDDKLAYKMPLLCGDKVKFNAKITRLVNGQILYDSKRNMQSKVHRVDQNNAQNIEMQIGDINYPLIFSYALHGKVPVGRRTVIAKGKTFRAEGTKINQIFNQNKIPLDEYLMLELTDFKNN